MEIETSTLDRRARMEKRRAKVEKRKADHLREMEIFDIHCDLLRKGWSFGITRHKKHWGLFSMICDWLPTLESRSDITNVEAVELKKCRVTGFTEWKAVVCGFTSFLSELLQIGYPVNIVLDDYGNTMLHGAARYGNTSTVLLLLKYGANVAAVTRRNLLKYPNFTPLHFAAAAGARSKTYARLYERVVELLVEAGADINARDGNGMTPLHHAVIKGNTHMVSFLLHDMKCDKNIEDNSGHTAVHFAFQDMKRLFSE